MFPLGVQVKKIGGPEDPPPDSFPHDKRPAPQKSLSRYASFSR